MSNKEDFFIERETLQEYVGPGGAIVIPDNVKRIGRYAFGSRVKIASITIPSSVNYIVWPVFRFCYYLKELILEGEVIEISAETFSGCSNLQRLVAPGVCWEGLKVNKMLTPGAIGFLCHPEVYKEPETVRMYLKYTSTQKKRLVPILLANDWVTGIVTYAANGQITKANFESVFLQPALEVNATQCIAFLLDWKDRHLPTKADTYQI